MKYQQLSSDDIMWDMWAIHHLRTRLNLSQEEFGAMLGASHMTVSRWERGVNEPSKSLKAKLSQISKKHNIHTEEMKCAMLLLKIINNFDSYTGDHCGRIALFCEELGKRLGYDSDKVDVLTFAGWLHDLGKISIPHTILNKDGQLTGQEKEIVQAHPLFGRLLLENMNMEDISVIVGQHHERIDGNGYPDRLTGDDIVEEAKLLSVLDVFDALTANRQYRNAVCVEDALDILASSAGLDRKYIDMLRELIKDGFLSQLEQGSSRHYYRWKNGPPAPPAEAEPLAPENPIDRFDDTEMRK